MTAAVTGGAGFIGRHLVDRLLREDYAVRVLTRRNRTALPQGVNVYQGDLASDQADLSCFLDGADLLFHCGAETRCLDRMMAVNEGGTERLLRAAKGRIGRWIQLSSVGVYGTVGAGVVTEAAPLNPVGTYERSKAQSDRLVMRHAPAISLQYAILRPSIVFGPGMTNRSLYDLMRMVDRRLFFFIGRPGASANYIPVANVVDALMLCAIRPAAASGVYNLSDHRSIEELVGAVAAALGAPAPRLRIPERPVRMAARICNRFVRLPLTEGRVNALTSRSVYATARIERELGYSHSLTVEDALQEMVKTWKCRGENACAS
jgi:nucleoside-diphosphate-sugar epimerase